LAFHPAGEKHSNQWHSTGGRIFHIQVARSRLECARAYSPILDGPADFQGGVAPWLAGRLYREYRRADELSLLAMEGLTLEILAEVSRRRADDSERKPPSWLLRIRELLQERFSENLSLDQVAAAVGIHPVHVARVFRQRYGCTLGDYLRKLRVEYACRQLATSDTPLVAIALAAGFADQSHFTKTFKRYMGMTPTQFQEHFRSR
jgi:AraC family transcriptional regulator